MIKKSLKAVLFTSLTLSLLLSAQKVKEKDLPPRHQEWLKLVRYIILPQEREVFFQLANDRERDLFIETFWKQRDPTPGTPQNEYKDEHLERFQHANKRFKFGGKEGWMTDRGRIYIILGPPVSTNRFPSAPNIYPCEIWSYYGDPAKGLPTHFSLVFFQRGGVGEYKLYDPISDGPSSLMIDGHGMDPFDYENLYVELQKRNPELALVSLSLVPGDVSYNFQPSMRSATIMANVFESPKKDVNPTYSTHFLEYRGIVSTEYLTNYVESTTDTALIRDPVLGLNFLHFSMAPSSVSVDYYEPNDQYFCNYTIDVSLKTDKEAIFQYEKIFPFYFSPQDLERVRGSGIAIEDSFPVAAGRYELNILLRNSVGKEFSVFERRLDVPPDSDLPQVNGPFLGYRFEEHDSSQHMPFKVMNKKLLVDPKKTFSPSDSIAVLFNITNLTQELWREGEVKIFVDGLKENNPVKKSYVLRLENYPFRRLLSIDYSLPSGELAPDYYEIKLSLLGRDERVLDEKSTEFVISLTQSVSHPIERMKAFPLHNHFLFLYIMAQQNENLENFREAEQYYERAYTLNPDYETGLLRYAGFLIKTGKYNKSLLLIEKIQNSEKLKFEYYLMKGQALTGLEQYMQAIQNLLEANKIYNSDTRLLNSLGFCYYKTAQKSKALDVLKASLRLNPQQDEVKKLMEQIEKD
jgi:GWxTD domain-containing protein